MGSGFIPKPSPNDIHPVHTQTHRTPYPFRQHPVTHKHKHKHKHKLPPPPLPLLINPTPTIASSPILYPPAQPKPSQVTLNTLDSPARNPLPPSLPPLGGCLAVHAPDSACLGPPAYSAANTTTTGALLGCLLHLARNRWLRRARYGMANYEICRQAGSFDTAGGRHARHAEAVGRAHRRCVSSRPVSPYSCLILDCAGLGCAGLGCAAAFAIDIQQASWMQDAHLTPFHSISTTIRPRKASGVLVGCRAGYHPSSLLDRKSVV